MNESNFQHILRVLNTNLNGKVKVMFALTSIKGVGRRFSNIACKKAEVDLNKRCERSFLPLHFGLIAGSELPILSSLSQIEICVRLRDGSSEPQGTQDAGIRCQGALARGRGLVCQTCGVNHTCTFYCLIIQRGFAERCAPHCAAVVPMEGGSSAAVTAGFREQEEGYQGR